MANLTFADYKSTTVARMNENRDNLASNRKIREEDVERAINSARLRMVRKVGIGVYRNREVMDATQGDITPPADFFNEGIVKFKPSSGSSSRVLQVKVARDMDIDNPTWRDDDRTADAPTAIVWDLKTTGLVARLYPQPTAPVTNGLIWEYTAMLTDLAADSDTCPIMNLFPEFQHTLLQAGALYQLYMLEGGTEDEQIAKWKAIFDNECKDMESMKSRLFVANRQNTGRN